MAAHFQRLHARQMAKRAAHSPSFRRWRAANARRLARFAVVQQQLRPPAKGYGLRDILQLHGVAVWSSTPSGTDLATCCAVKHCCNRKRVACRAGRCRRSRRQQTWR